MNKNRLDLYDTKILKDIRSTVKGIYEYNFNSGKDSLSAKLKTVLKKIDHILEEYGEK